MADPGFVHRPSSPSTPPGTARLELLDCGRFIAAIGVLLFHYFFNGINNGKISSLTYLPAVVDVVKYGYLGVEFFFMISGYVIFFSAQNRSAGEFVVSRVVRLYPAFWVAVIFTATVAYFLGGHKMALRPGEILTNLTMVPQLFGHRYVDGVYWTLQLELCFYLVVLLCLLGGLQKKLTALALSWPYAMLALLLTGHGNIPLLGGYYTYFAAGVVFATLRARPSFYAWASLVVCLYLCLEHSLSHVVTFADSRGLEYSPAIVGAIVCGYFAVFLFLGSTKGSELKIPGSKLMGGLTYPLYLVHAHVGYMVLSRFATEANKALLYPLTIALVLVTAYLIHRLVEQRYANDWRRLFSNTAGRWTEWLSRQTRRISDAFHRRRQRLLLTAASREG